MTGEFKAFMARYFKALKESDLAFLKGVYLDWFGSSKVMPDRSVDEFLQAAMLSLKDMAGGKLAGSECFDDFCIAHCAGKDGPFDLTFRKKGDSYAFFNERSGFAAFSKVYALNYSIDGGKLRILFNGKRSPVVYEIEGSGFVTLINSALKAGENEITLEPIDAGRKVKASVQVSSGVEGSVMETTQGDVLNWSGTVEKPVKVKFAAV